MNSFQCYCGLNLYFFWVIRAYTIVWTNERAKRCVTMFFLSASTTIQWTWTEWSVWPKTSKSMLWNVYVHRKLQTHLVTLRLRERKVKAIKLHLFYDQFVVFFSSVINVNSDLEMPLQWLYQWHSNAHAHFVWLVCYLCVIWLWISDNGMRSTRKKKQIISRKYTNYIESIEPQMKQRIAKI